MTLLTYTGTSTADYPPHGARRGFVVRPGDSVELVDEDALDLLSSAPHLWAFSESSTTTTAETWPADLPAVELADDVEAPTPGDGEED